MAIGSVMSKSLINLKRLLIPSLGDGNNVAARQRTPFNLNRYVLLVIYVLYTFLSACTYFGWRNFSHMLTKSGAYVWLCKNPNSISEAPDSPLCDEQDTHIQSLFTIAMACHFTMSAVSGWLVDLVGPKITAMLGQSMNFTGWIILAFCGTNFRAYVAAFVFIGGGADTSFLPTLLLANLFPLNSALCITTLGSAVSASFAVPLILDTIWDANASFNFFSLCIGYLFFGPILCGIVAMLFLPLKSYLTEDQINALSAEAELENKKPDMKVTHHSTADIENTDNNVSAKQNGFDVEMSNSKTFEESNKNILQKVYYGEDVSFKKLLISNMYIGISFYFVMCSFAMAYYQEAAGRMFSPNVEHILGLLVPFSFVPCIILGKMIDNFGIMVVIFFVNSAGTLMYLLACFNVIGLHYVSVILYTIYISVYTSQLYCFVNETFSMKHFGKLLGIASCLGGLLSLLTNFMYSNITVSLMKGNPLCMNIVFSVALFALFSMLGCMYIFKRKKNNNRQKFNM